jgi:hypothetical protein
MKSESDAFPKIAFKFLEGSVPPFLRTPPLDLFEIDSCSLFSADEHSLPNLGPLLRQMNPERDSPLEPGFWPAGTPVVL